ncbi:MAG: hypothetical protein ACE5R6_00925 [Candidatus Heimdallarchaeota archaeon]
MEEKELRETSKVFDKKGRLMKGGKYIDNRIEGGSNNGESQRDLARSRKRGR